MKLKNIGILALALGLVAATPPTQLGTIGNYQPYSINNAGTSCTFSQSSAGCSTNPKGDCGSFVNFTSSSAVTVTLPNNITIVNCSLTILQSGSGKVSFSPYTGSALKSRPGFSGSAGQFAIFGVVMYSNSGGTSALYDMFGDGS